MIWIRFSHRYGSHMMKLLLEQSAIMYISNLNIQTSKKNLSKHLKNKIAHSTQY